MSKRVLGAIAASHPDAGSYAVHAVEITRGWGDLVNVTVHASRDGTAPTTGSGRPSRSDEARAIRTAVEEALAPERCRVSVLEQP